MLQKIYYKDYKTFCCLLNYIHKAKHCPSMQMPTPNPWQSLPISVSLQTWSSHILMAIYICLPCDLETSWLQCPGHLDGQMSATSPSISATHCYSKALSSIYQPVHSQLTLKRQFLFHQCAFHCK